MVRTLASWWRDKDGAIAPFLAMLLIPIIGMVGLGGEVSSWYMKQRQIQNAADTAALAAAANGVTTSVNGVPSYQREAYGAAGAYGYQNRANGDVTIAATQVNCPGTSSGLGCFQVAITEKVPLYLTQILGYKGNVTKANGAMSVSVGAIAIASGKTGYNYCVVGLGTGGNVKDSKNNLSFSGNGSGFENCAARSNGSVKCSSTDFGAILAPDQQGGSCNGYQAAAATFTDPYAGLGISAKIAAALAAAPACSGTGIAVGTHITATTTVICSTNNTITGSGADNTVHFDGNGTDPVVVIVNNTTWNTNGKNIEITGAAGGTIIFTGPGTTGLPEWMSGNGNVYVQGANGGTFDDFAIIADPKYTTTTPFRPGGGSQVNTYTLGTIYAPNTDIGMEGSMHSTIGSRKCLSVIAKSIYDNGNSVDNNPLDCIALGYNLSTVLTNRQALVQ